MGFISAEQFTPIMASFGGCQIDLIQKGQSVDHKRLCDLFQFASASAQSTWPI